MAARYRDDPEAAQKLAEAIKNGGAGNWTEQTGGIPMPANSPAVSDEDIAAMVSFILELP